VDSQFKNNNEGDAPQRMFDDSINNINREKSTQSKELILPRDDNGATDRVLGPVIVHPDGYDEHDSANCNEQKNQIATTSKNSSVCTSNIDHFDPASHVNELPATNDASSPSDETIKIQNVPALKQSALETSEHNIDLGSTSTEDSCY
ncbi:unnamed protein product, partial [Rotaria sp. Silwood2]